MTTIQTVAHIVLPIQTGAIFASAMLVVLYQALGFASNSKYYKDAEIFIQIFDCSVIIAFVASLVIATLPKKLGLRRRGFKGCIIAVAILLLNSLMNPIILPETRESLREYPIQ